MALLIDIGLQRVYPAAEEKDIEVAPTAVTTAPAAGYYFANYNCSVYVNIQVDSLH